jgi:chromosomal replication initiation ATPase DnaA
MESNDRIMEAAIIMLDAEAAINQLLNSTAVLSIDLSGENKNTHEISIAELLVNMKQEVREQFFAKKRLTADVIISSVCEIRDLNPEVIKSYSRKKEYVFSRWLCYYFLHNLLGYGWSKIGSIFNRDHSTVIYGLTTIENELQINTDLKNDFITLRRKFYSYKNENSSQIN